MTERANWLTTTHDWARDVDPAHLAFVRAWAGKLAPTGAVHLVLEVLAYCADEAEATGRVGQVEVTLDDDGSIKIEDDGRGTDTRRAEHGRPVRKPVMSTADVRFFRQSHGVVLADGALRQGMSVVAGLSSWLVHASRSVDGAWSQRYEHGTPVGELAESPPGARTGTSVHFLPDPALVEPVHVTATVLRRLAGNERLAVDVHEER